MRGKRKLLVKNQNKGTLRFDKAEAIYIYVKYLILNSCQLLINLFIHESFIQSRDCVKIGENL